MSEPEVPKSCCQIINEAIAETIIGNTQKLTDIIPEIQQAFPLDEEALEQEADIRIAVAKLKYDHVNAQVLTALTQLQSKECDEGCCGSAVISITTMAVTILEASYDLVLNPKIDATYPSGDDVEKIKKKYSNVVLKSNLELLIDNLDCELQKAIDAILDSVCPCGPRTRCDDSETEDSSSSYSSCDRDKKRKKKCRKCPDEEWFEGEKKSLK